MEQSSLARQTPKKTVTRSIDPSVSAKVLAGPSISDQPRECSWDKHPLGL